MRTTPSLSKRHDAKVRQRLGGGRNQRRHFRAAAFASVDQPAVSRKLTNVSAAACSISPATSRNSGASCVQAIVIVAAGAAAARKRIELGAAELTALR